MTAAEITWRLRAGSLIRVHPGVYRVGHAAPSIDATYAAAVKACGEGAVLAGLAAAHLHRLLRGRAPLPEVVVRRERRVEGVRTSRRRIEPGDVTGVRRIPVTTVARTVVDLAGILRPPALARAVHEAAVIQRIEPAEIEAVLSRRHNWPGRRKLMLVLFGDTPVVLSRLEARFLERLREAGLPLPRTNQRAGGRVVDCRWQEHRLTIELDGYRYHRTRHAWERDRQREREARARGEDFRRYTYADVFERPEAMLRELRDALVVRVRAG